MRAKVPNSCSCQGRAILTGPARSPPGLVAKCLPLFMISSGARGLQVPQCTAVTVTLPAEPGDLRSPGPLASIL